MAEMFNMDKFVEEAGRSAYEYALELFQEMYGVSLQRMEVLAKADLEGRIVLLPEDKEVTG